ncbi:MAG TPA: NADH-quinone oxidoreductase subunit N [Oligoflexia bacterium]|nr:NADH-quinone oxidoreductase subunit N [Oligoflexia bacterium]
MEEFIKPQNLSLSPQQLSVLMPYLVVMTGGLITLLLGVFRKAVNMTVPVAAFSVLTMVLAAYSLFLVWGEPTVSLFNDMMVVDNFSNLFNLIFIVATGLVIVGSNQYLVREGIEHFEYYSLMLFSCLGMMFMASAKDLIVLFIALEIMSIAVYVLVGFKRADTRSNEAALKYFILGGLASAILLYGVALLYGATGSMNIQALAAAVQAGAASNLLFVLGAALVTGGLLFKVATVPFHMWMPDVYQGAPTTVTAFMTTGLKAAAFAAFVRFFMNLGYGADLSSTLYSGLYKVLWVSAIATMLIGNIIALTQKNIKRMLAYSSIAHTGYLIVAILCGGRSEYGYSSVLVYMAGYVVMNIGAFAVVAMLSEKNDRHTNIEDYAGLGFKKPLTGLAMTIFMFSMAGVPPTVGFAGKYLIFLSAVQAGEVLLAVLSVLCSAISAYYYLRVIVFMYMKDPVPGRAMNHTLAPAFVIGISAVITMQLGLFPSVLIEAAKKAAMMF